ncbi:hypothetical protein [uncultured Weissella sp.]|uniref:hypothetical protein n=1 Tax=uncultured Weissella sp. TaxID=253243 RepID=UPI0025975BA4|nr:hypothetical protein [uncultured Weissella sp.]
MASGYIHLGKFINAERAKALIASKKKAGVLDLVQDEVSSHFPFSKVEWLALDNRNSNQENSTFYKLETYWPTMAEYYNETSFKFTDDNFESYKFAWELKLLEHKMRNGMEKEIRFLEFYKIPKLDKTRQVIEFLGRLYHESDLKEFIEDTKIYRDTMPGFVSEKSKFPVTNQQLVELYELILHTPKNGDISNNSSLNKINQVNPVWAQAILHKNVDLENPNINQIRAAFESSKVIKSVEKLGWITDLDKLEKLQLKRFANDKTGIKVKVKKPIDSKAKSKKQRKVIENLHNVVEVLKTEKNIRPGDLFPFNQTTWSRKKKDGSIYDVKMRFIQKQYPNYYEYLQDERMIFDSRTFEEHVRAWNKVMSAVSVKESIIKRTISKRQANDATKNKSTVQPKRKKATTMDRLNKNAGKKTSKVNTKANISKKKQGKNQNDYLVRQEERRLRKSRNRLTYYDDQTYMDYLPVRYPSVRSRHNDGGGWS